MWRRARQQPANNAAAKTQYLVSKGASKHVSLNLGLVYEASVGIMKQDGHSIAAVYQYRQSWNDGVTGHRDSSGSSFVGGRLSVDLDTLGDQLDDAFGSGLFGFPRPRFGGFRADASTGFGFALLSDIEAFFLLDAFRSNRGENRRQAPTVQLFNSQDPNSP